MQSASWLFGSMVYFNLKRKGKNMLTTELKRARRFHDDEGGCLLVTPKGYLVTREMPYLVHAFPSQAKMVQWCFALAEASYDESKMPNHLRHPILFPRANKPSKREPNSKVVKAWCQFCDYFECWSVWVCATDGTKKVVFLMSAKADIVESDLRLAFVETAKKTFGVTVKQVERMGDRLVGSW